MSKRNIKVKILISLRGRIISSFRFGFPIEKDRPQDGKSRPVMVQLNSSAVFFFADVLYKHIYMAAFSRVIGLRT